MHFRAHGQEQFAGRVLDGPHEGDWVEQESPWFEAYHAQPVRVVASFDELPSTSYELDRVLYKWLHGYRAWAWVQPMADRVNAKKLPK